MADPPGVDLVADTKKNLENRLMWKMCLFLILVVVILLVHSSAMSEKVVILLTPRLPVFTVFLAVMQALGTKGAAIASQQVFCWFWSTII